MNIEARFQKTYYLTKDNIKRVKYQAVDEDKNESDIINEIVEEHFKNRNKAK